MSLPGRLACVALLAAGLAACSDGWAAGEPGTGLSGSAAADDVGIGREGDQPVNSRGDLGWDYESPDPLSRR